MYILLVYLGLSYRPAALEDLAGDLGKNVERHDREDERDGEHKHDERLDLETLGLLVEDLEHGGRGPAGASCSGGCWCLCSSRLVGSSLGQSLGTTWDV